MILKFRVVTVEPLEIPSTACVGAEELRVLLPTLLLHTPKDTLSVGLNARFKIALYMRLIRFECNDAANIVEP